MYLIQNGFHSPHQIVIWNFSLQVKDETKRVSWSVLDVIADDKTAIQIKRSVEPRFENGC